MERKSYTFNAKITPVNNFESNEKTNKSFTLCKCYIMGLGKNRNLSNIDKEVSDAAIPSLYGIPVIGHVYEDEDGNYHMGGHDSVIQKDENGAYKWKSLCVPYGFVAQTQNNLHYEDVKEPNGDTRTYLVGDIILWTGRYEDLKKAIYNKDLYFGQSMEINVEKYAPLEEDKNYTNILEFDYSALCLLGKSDDSEFHVEPCFPMAHVEPYTYSFDDKFNSLMEELKNEISASFGVGGKGAIESEMETNTIDEIIEQQSSDVGVDSSLYIKGTEVGVSEDKSFVELTIDDVEGDGGEQTAVEDNGQDSNADSEEGDTTEVDAACKKKSKCSFSSSYLEKLDAICKLFDNSIEYDEDGHPVMEVCWYVRDFTDEYVYVEKYTWNDSGYKTEQFRCKYEFNADEMSAKLAGDLEKCYVKWLTAEESEAINKLNKEYEELLSYKAEREEADRKASYDQAMEEFSDMSDNPEYGEIYQNRYSYNDIESLKNACYIIRGKFSLIAPQKKSSTTSTSEPIIPVNNAPAHQMTAREKLHATYGKHK